MANARRDDNYVTTLMGVAISDLETPTLLAVDAATNRLLVSAIITSMPEVSVSASVDTTGLASDTNQTNGSQKTQIVDSGGEAVTVTGGKLDVNATASLSGESLPVSSASEAVAVAIVDNSGNQISSFGGGTQYTEGDTDESITGTAALVESAANALAVLTQPLTDTQLRASDVKVSLDGESVAVTGTFYQATQPISGTVTANLSATDNAVLDSIDGKITACNTGSIAGSVTANAGTNLNTSALALESGGNLATIAGKDFATSAKQDTIIGHVDGIETLLGTIAGDTTSIDGKITTCNTGNVTIGAAIPAGDNNIGNVDIASSVALDVSAATVTVDATGQGDIPITLDGETVATTEVAPTTIYNGQNTVAAAGTAEALASSQAVKSVTIKALSGNTGDIYVGNSDVDNTNGFVLSPGDTISMDIANLATVYIDSATNGDGVSYIGVN